MHPAGDAQPQHPARGDWKVLREGESGPIFLDEDVACAAAWPPPAPRSNGTSNPGCPHPFDHLAPQTDVAHRARADRLRALTSF
ncbi:hypothetical protein [Streptomyces sp. 2A115]|uniref:hypothetical protein n=1 Tax=Streptomyces sp. 2A115 TaxID=3457439 RepID=UPI003FD21B28